MDLHILCSDLYYYFFFLCVCFYQTHHRCLGSRLGVYREFTALSFGGSDVVAEAVGCGSKGEGEWLEMATEKEVLEAGCFLVNQWFKSRVSRRKQGNIVE